MIKYAASAAVIAIATIYILIAIFSYVIYLLPYGFTIVFASPIIPAIAVSVAWWKFRKRRSSYREKIIIVLVYWFILIFFFLMPIHVLPTLSSLASIMLNTIIYPIFLLIFFGISDRFDGNFQRAMTFFFVTGSFLFIALTLYNGHLKITEILSVG